MPRKSASSKPTSTPASSAKAGHKRQLSTPATTSNDGTPSTRVSKRLKDSASNTPASATGTRSKYFEAPGSGSSDDEDQDMPDAADDSASGYDSADGSDGDEDGDEEEEEEARENDYDSEEDAKPKKKKGGKKAATTGKTVFGKQSSSSQMWREGVKTGLGPGKQVFIEKPKPRGDGGVKYMGHRLHPNTMLFLADLKANNDREWLKMHDPDFRQSWKDWESMVEVLTEKISEIDETVPELPPKDLVFRIYRDVRFSPDPTPYKTHFSAAWSRTGRKGPYAHYYVQISPHGQSFVGAGIWMPEAQPLALLRRSVDRKPEKLRDVLTASAFRRHILGGVSNEERKVVKAFASQNSANALKTKPKGYAADHKDIELLRLRNFTAGHRLSEAQVLSPDLVQTIMALIGALFPFVTYLNSVVMPDEDASSSEESDQDEDE